MKSRRDRYRLLAKTAARKSPRQFVGILSRKARNRIIPQLPIDVDERYRRKVPEELETDFGSLNTDLHRLRASLSKEERERYRQLSSEFANGSLTFLNRTREIPNPTDVKPDDDRLSDLPRLWFIKLASFEPFLWGILGYESPGENPEFATRLDSWLDSSVRRERIGSRLGYLRGFWAPYAVSLRIIALARYGAWRNGLSDTETRFLFKNLLFLTSNVEYDVGGNHLIENGAALVIGGCAFSDAGRRFVDQGLDVLREAVETQFLDDGYHFERSPMYHLAVTERLLSVISVLGTSNVDVPEWLNETTADACSFIEYIRPADDRIPLLNDAVFNQTHRLETMLAYASSIDVDAGSRNTPGKSGLYWFDTAQTRLLLDAGNSGPVHQMAHTHNDPCTLLIWENNHRMVTDTGAYDYQPGEKRSVARSVSSHNTVQIGESEPVDYGGRFRMSDSILTTTTMSTQGEITALRAEYQGRKRESYHHQRTVYVGDDWLLVWDEIDSGTSPYISRLHAHPEVSIEQNSTITLTHGKGSILHVHPVDTYEVVIENGPYFPEFGVQKERPVVELQSESGGFGYFVLNRDIEPKLERANSEPALVRTDNQTQVLPQMEL
ncbi:heparinase II/III family protein [Halorubellus salinus]|uniref:heparinase II/III family protein n=1 Tax=Halorubellus salinus TaxID=755309 RepID=UPI001D06C583|nr:heparinase II/III family protein [Halorubellus salinus]